MVNKLCWFGEEKKKVKTVNLQQYTIKKKRIFFVLLLYPNTLLMLFVIQVSWWRF